MPVDNLPLNSQKVICLNGTCIPTDKTELTLSDLEFFVYPFSDKETTVIPVLPNTSDTSFGFDLKDYKLSGCMYIKDVDDTMSSCAAKSFGTSKQSRQKIWGTFITKIDGNWVFSTAQAQDKLKSLFEEFLKAKDQGVDKFFSFEITFAAEDKLKGKQLNVQLMTTTSFFLEQQSELNQKFLKTWRCTYCKWCYTWIGW